jgi:serine/threonine protein kinase
MDTIGPYKILQTLVAGRRPLYLATAKDGSRVAIKTAPLEGLSEEERARFQREAAVCAQLDHPVLVRVIDSGETPELLYQVMEYLEGSDMGKVLASGRQFSWEEKLSIMDAVCDGLEYAHARHLVHRDIKPANLFMQNSGRARILDFGMARTDSSQFTRVGAAVGTLNYMAPEQIRGEKCTAASDVFAAGIVFYQIATGRHPFGAGRKSLPEILSAILFEQPPAWDAAGAPEGMEFVIRRALEKDPAKRWQRGGELRQALSLCRFTLENRPAGAPDAAPVTPAAPEVRPDFAKTVVMRRAPAKPAPPPPPAPPAPAAAPSPPPVAKPRPVPSPPAQAARFCPSCTHANVAGATVCVRCGVPLIAPPAVPASDPPLWQTNAAIWIALGGTVLLLIVIVLWMVSR